MNAVYPGVPTASRPMSSGASDSMWYRHAGRAELRRQPDVHQEHSEDFSHGLNERTPLSNLRPAIDYYLVLVKDSAGQGFTRAAGRPRSTPRGPRGTNRH